MFFLRFRLLLLLLDIWRLNVLNWKLHLSFGWRLFINGFFSNSNYYFLFLRSLSSCLWHYLFRFWCFLRKYLRLRWFGSFDNRLDCSSTWLRFLRWRFLLYRWRWTCSGVLLFFTTFSDKIIHAANYDHRHCEPNCHLRPWRYQILVSHNVMLILKCR